MSRKFISQFFGFSLKILILGSREEKKIMHRSCRDDLSYVKRDTLYNMRFMLSRHSSSSIVSIYSDVLLRFINKTSPHKVSADPGNILPFLHITFNHVGINKKNMRLINLSVAYFYLFLKLGNNLLFYYASAGASSVVAVASASASAFAAASAAFFSATFLAIASLTFFSASSSFAAASFLFCSSF